MTSIASNAHPDAPIGIFDSGVGGLSVLRHIRAQLPQEDLIYFADSGHAPYGDKTEQQVIDRSLAVAGYLLQQGAKALVVACNTATIAAIKALRARYPDLPIVGVEPGLKPAAAISRNGKIGVLATERTLRGDKLLALREQVSSATGATFILQPCVGLVERIEQSAMGSDPLDATSAMLDRYIAPLLAQGVDTLVLGCTHYPFVQDAIERTVRAHTSEPVTLVDTGDAVARQLARLLDAASLRRTSNDAPRLLGYTTAKVEALAQAFAGLLDLQPPVAYLSV
ncbi:glutamate racemase [Janthinobacterium rivuli]|uniref:Glutamate racemase n=1 Tax=Janthinobacterium rivuli TaxID=2751478 RepID=A0ABY8I9Y2_9BURK|nr:glutamate racemase [Janthinobacterium rivuli]PHV34556.1 glutamate racemase [Janthinobacterium sp. BJB312]WFR80873.1 glutamate racemase [Janthinobacterium rivuli]